MVNLTNFDVIIFDCDGVILDVNNLKVKAFGETVEDYPLTIREEFVDYCSNNFGISRYVKFEKFLRDFAKEEFTQEKYDLLLEKYALKCIELYKNSDFTSKAKEVIHSLVNNGKKLYVASGSDEAELKEVFKEKAINKYFLDIYGSPKSKKKCVEEIIKSHESEKILFIGDAVSDLNAAKTNKISFMYMFKYTIQDRKLDGMCREQADYIVEDLSMVIK